LFLWQHANRISHTETIGIH